MSIFTKIFVVLDMLLAVVLVALVVPFVVNTKTYQDEYRMEQALRQAAEHTAANREADVARLIDAQKDQVTELTNKNTRLIAQLGDKDANIQQLNADKVRLQSDNANFGLQMARLATAEKQHAQINEILQTEIVDRREKNIELEKRAIELAASLRNSQTEVETLTRLNRLNTEKLKDLSAENEKLAAAAEAGGAPKASAEAPGTLRDLTGGTVPSGQIVVRGIVTGAETIGDQTFVALNVGTNDKVTVGTRFMIHRGNQYLGDALVTAVDFNSSAARVTLKTGEIQANDEALSGGL